MPNMVVDQHPRLYRCLFVLLPYVMAGMTLLFPLTSYLLVSNTQKIDRQQASNTRAILFICATNGVLDDLVVQAADQIQLSFTNGTYSRLLKSHVLRPTNVAAARSTLRHYRDVHKQLVGPRARACPTESKSAAP